ncbi:MAG: ATP-binding protein [Clostridia bacterium]|nr:ATP-binding protein [Clostridia bacterium]
MNRRMSAHVDYTRGMKEIDEEARSIIHRFENNRSNLKDERFREEIQDFISHRAENHDLKILITDLEGNIHLQAGENPIQKVDLFQLIKNAMDAKIEDRRGNDRKEFVSLYPAEFADFKGYLFVSGIPQGSIVYDEGGYPVVVATTGIMVFVALFMLLTKRKVAYIQTISDGLMEISRGNLDHRVSVKGSDEFALLASNINHMGSELKENIEKERKAEKLKNELITNVSHDLKTPLTSVMGYLGLLLEHRYESRIQMEEYLRIAFNKSQKLKSLIEDLFEYTKLANEGIKLNKTKVDLGEFVEQLVEELIPVGEKESLEFIKELPGHRIKISVDADKMARVLDNLLMNAIRYSHKPGRIIINLSDEGEQISIRIQNKGDHISDEDLMNLFERFYRIDKARTSTAGGSGLGLAIARSIVELHDGRIIAQCEGNDISFTILLPKTDL